jgi:hypothetical protein
MTRRVGRIFKNGLTIRGNMTIKEIVTLKGLARFSHAIAGTLYLQAYTAQHF